MSSHHISRQDMLSYLGNGPSSERSHELEKHLLACPTCAEALKELTQTGAVGMGHSLPKADPKTAAFAENVSGPVEKSSLLNRVLWTAAAGIALFLTLGLMVYNTNNLAPEQLFAKYFKGYKDYTSTNFRSTSGAGRAANNESLVAAMVPYREENYHLAIATLTDYLKADPGNVPATFYLGISMLQERKYEAALSYFQNAQDPNLPTYAEPALWHEALCHLRIGNKEKAKSLFSKVLDSNNGTYAEEAKQILDSL